MSGTRALLFRLLTVLLHWVGHVLKNCAAKVGEHYDELLDYKDSSTTISDNSTEFSTHNCIYGTLLGQQFVRKKTRITTKSQHLFQMSQRTQTRIHNEYALDQLRKNHNSVIHFADCAASILLLACFRNSGDPDNVTSNSHYSSFQKIALLPLLPLSSSFLPASDNYFSFRAIFQTITTSSVEGVL